MGKRLTDRKIKDIADSLRAGYTQAHTAIKHKTSAHTVTCIKAAMKPVMPRWASKNPTARRAAEILRPIVVFTKESDPIIRINAHLAQLQYDREQATKDKVEAHKAWLNASARVGAANEEIKQVETALKVINSILERNE